MSPEDAEAVLALQAELVIALELAADEASYRQDWRIQYAAERVLERVFQAAQNLPETRRHLYFSDGGFQALRGMRNRLAHNYLAVDDNILWEAISVDIPQVYDRLQADAAAASILIRDLMAGQDTDSESWRRTHLGSIGPQDGQRPEHTQS